MSAESSRVSRGRGPRLTRAATSAGFVVLDGALVAAATARVSALDRGLLYGDGLFETLRSYQGVPFAFADHLARLRAGGKRIRLRVPGSTSWWRTRVSTLLVRNHLGDRDALVRITVTRGAGGDTLLPPRRLPPTTLITARPVPSEIAKLQEVGVAVVLLPFHPGIGGLLSGVKTTDYLTAMMGKLLARERSAFEGIYQSAAGEILEGTTSNVFIVDGRGLATPPLSAGILPGITRQRVLALARAYGFDVRERTIAARELRGAKAAFLTASSIELLPIRAVDGRELRGDRSLVDELRRRFATARDAELSISSGTQPYKN
jgi:branched-subunit amino acid aminotransferase/4-amino-4-deoxychorismate lyase